MKALVLGAAGLLGSELMAMLPDAMGVTRSDLSITDLGAIERAVTDRRPDVVFNCAAFNAVDRAETEQDAAYQVNAQGAFNVAIACARNGVRLIHFSTNFVFDGALDRPYVEADAVGPQSVYAKSKLEGEQLVSMVMPQALIARTAALYGGRSLGGHVSFPERIVTRALKGEPVRVVSDQTVNPTYGRDLAAAAIELAAGELAGVVHLVAAECCAWDELARAALAACGVDAPVESMPSAALAAPAARPRNGCLESSRVKALRSWRDALVEWAGRRAAADAATP